MDSIHLATTENIFQIVTMTIRSDLICSMYTINSSYQPTASLHQLLLNYLHHFLLQTFQSFLQLRVDFPLIHNEVYYLAHRFPSVNICPLWLYIEFFDLNNTLFHSLIFYGCFCEQLIEELFQVSKDPFIRLTHRIRFICQKTPIELNCLFGGLNKIESGCCSVNTVLAEGQQHFLL